MGRAPCCDKANVKKGPWSPEEDAKLKSYIEQHGTGGNWIALPQKIGLKRCGKSCRLRWLNYLRPNLKHGGFSEEEDNIICSLYTSIGSRWSVIAAQLPGRTDNDIKNYWNTRLKKKLLGKHRNNINKEQQHQQARKGNNNRGSGTYCDSLVSSLVPQNSSSQQQLEPYNWPNMMPMLPQIMPPLVPRTNQSLGPCFNDQDSIKKLLIKLGGRFNSNDDYHQFSQQNYDQEHVQLGSNSSAYIISTNNISNNEVQFAIDQEMVSTNFQQGLNGLEFFYGEDTITPINHPFVASNYQLGDQGVTRQLETHAQDQCDLLQELISYPGEQQ